jgi:hypothetical protein
MQVFVLDKKKNPLMPCHPARARELLKREKAVVHKIAPFNIRLLMIEDKVAYRPTPGAFGGNSFFFPISVGFDL